MLKRHTNQMSMFVCLFVSLGLRYSPEISFMPLNEKSGRFGSLLVKRHSYILLFIYFYSVKVLFLFFKI